MNIFKFSRVAWVILIVAVIGLRMSSLSAIMIAQGEIVVGLTPGTEIETVNDQFGTTLRHYLPLLDLYLLDSPEGADLDELCASVRAHTAVIFCHPNYLVDPMRGVQSSLPFSDDLGTKDRYVTQPAVDLLNIEAVQAISTGTGQTVGVVDGGVNMEHPAFEGRVVSGWDYVDNDPDANEVPGGINSGHGTFVAGVIHLVVPDATIRSYRVCDTEGEADGFVVAEAILQAIEDGCGVVNVSLSTYEVHQAIAHVCEYAKEQNVLVVCAAGNEYSEVGHYPGSDANTLAIAALDSGFTLADYSDFGQTISLVAPGTDIYAPFLDSGYAWWSGTSFASPFVAAEAAMLRALEPTMTYDRLISLLVGSAIGVDQINADYIGQLGAGVLNPLGAATILLGDCGDLDSDHMVSINDLVYLIDAMYITKLPTEVSSAIGLDGRMELTNNDLASLASHLFYLLYPNYCAPMLEPKFPRSDDTIIVSGTDIPAGVDEWTVVISARLSSPGVAHAVALSYDLPGETITLTNIEHRIQSVAGPFSVEDPTGQQLVLANVSMSGPGLETFEVAFLTFGFTPADTVRTISFAPTTFKVGEATHTSVISRFDSANNHTLGWAPLIVTDGDQLEMDRYGHPCFGDLRGDVDTDLAESVDIADLTMLIKYLFVDRSIAIAYGEADVAPRPSPDGVVDVSDLTVLIEYLFITYEPLPTCDD